MMIININNVFYKLLISQRIATYLHQRHNLLQRLLYRSYLSTFKQDSQRFYSNEKHSLEHAIKETCNVGTIGHVDHGKTTLTAAITKYLSEIDKTCRYVSYAEIDKAPEEKQRGITINIAHVGYSTKKRQYAHTDCPGHVDFIKNMISGASQMDGAILVIAADDGPMPQTKEHLLLISQIGIKHVIVYVNKVDLVNKDIMELVEMETRELLDMYGFDNSKIPFVYGSALLALNGDKSEIGIPSVQSLLNILDDWIPTASRDYDSPFMLPIDDVFAVPGRGTVVVGTLTQGLIQKGVAANVLGFNAKLNTHISDIQIFKKSVPKAYAGQNIGVLLRGIKLNSIRRGMIVCKSNSVSSTNHFEAQFYLLSENEGGRRKPLPVNGFCTVIFCSTWNAYCRFDFLLPPNIPMLMPGEFASAKLSLLYHMPLLEGKVFTVREHKQTIGTGKITKVCEPIHFDKFKMNEIKLEDTVFTP